jgi:hypothetical protein
MFYSNIALNDGLVYKFDSTLAAQIMTSPKFQTIFEGGRTPIVD